MKDNNISTYNVRVQRSSYNAIERIIESGSMRPSREYRSGAGTGQIWSPVGRASDDQAALDDRTFQLGHKTIQANVYRLPGEAFDALVQGSWGRFARDVRIDQFVRVLTATALGSHDLDFTLSAATWLPEETRLIEQGRDWLLSLAFRNSANSGRRRCGLAAGVDVGLNPLAMTVIGDRFICTPAVGTIDGPHSDLGVRDAIEIAEYIAARQALDDLTRTLVHGASTVAVERLDLAGFRTGFVARGREAAILDWHQAWLPQDLRAAGISFVRVEPAYTSQQCCQCGSRATTRLRERLCCRSCSWSGNVHENAAVNIQRLGQRRLRWAS